MNRGEVWCVDFGQPFGSEPGCRRAVDDPFNRSRIDTVIVVPITSNTELAEAPGNVLCRSKQTGLRKTSVANVSQLSVIDRRRLLEKIGTIPPQLMTQLEDGVRLVLAL